MLARAWIQEGTYSAEMIETADQVNHLVAALPDGAAFTPLMTCYLTDGTDAEHVAEGHRDGVFFAVKLYPARATTNSRLGITDFANGNKASVLRRSGGKTQQFGVRLKDLVKRGDLSANVAMRPGDVLIIPQSFF